MLGAGGTLGARGRGATHSGVLPRLLSAAPALSPDPPFHLTVHLWPTLSLATLGKTAFQK